MTAELDRHGGGDAGGEDGGIAATLRDARQKTGVDLRDVAEALRIQYAYLQAIEDGRYDDLPGPAYALGFVRAYAEYLNLDVAETVRLFKAETRGLSQRQVLMLPEPLQEGRFPGGILLVAALIIAASIYGAWYFWERKQSTQVAAVPPVPPNLAGETTPGNPAFPAGATAPPPQPPSVPTPSEAQASSISANNFSSSQSGSGPSGTLSSSPSGTTPTGTPATGAASPAAPGETSTTVPTPLSKPAGLAQPAPAIAAAPPAAPANAGNTPTATSTGGSSSASSAPPEQVAAVKPSAPRAYGENNAGSRITLAAKQDSWVQVRDNEGNVVWTRILHAGDSYKVPNRTGLMLLTGNAGALDVWVDGKRAPSLGAEGAIRRNVALDPEKIAAGTAGAQ